MAQITYQDKVAININSDVPDINKVNAADMNEIKQVVNEIITTFLNKTYPIGSIYMSTINTDPNTLFGGTWEAWGTGRVPVGVDTTQTEFNTVEKTGGSKELQEHNHYGLLVTGTEVGFKNGSSSGFSIAYSDGQRGTSIYTSNEGTGNSGNLQPYITCYMWKRTA